jgi:hypothetical protein
VTKTPGRVRDYSGGPEWLVEEEPAKPTSGSVIVGFAYAVIAGVLLPVASPWFVLNAAIQYLRIMYVKIRSTVSSYGSDSALGFDVVASVVIIPVAGLVGTVGVSVAFYLLSEEDNVTWQSTGWKVLGYSVVATIALIWGTARTLSRHRSGTEVLVFEQDVEPDKGIEKLRGFRSARVPGFLPGRYKAADALAYEAFVDDIEATSGISLKQACKRIIAERRDRLHLGVIALLGVAWILCPFTWAASTYRWWLMLIVILATYLLLLLSASLTTQSFFYDRLRWLKRSWTLWCRKRAEQQIGAAHTVTLADLHEQIAALDAKIDALPVAGQSSLRRALRRSR